MPRGLSDLKMWPMNMDRNLPPIRVALFQPADVVSTIARKLPGAHGENLSPQVFAITHTILKRHDPRLDQITHTILKARPSI